jgi:hypothetical protein
MMDLPKNKGATSMSTRNEKTRENRLRRLAARQGLAIRKSRSRTPQSIEYGGYMIINPYRNSVEAGGHPHSFAMGLDDIEEYLVTAEAELEKPAQFT